MHTDTVPLPFLHRPNPTRENSGSAFDPSYGHFFSTCEIETVESWCSAHVKQRIVFFRAKGYKAPTIAKLLRREGIRSSRVGISKFLRKFELALLSESTNNTVTRRDTAATALPHFSSNKAHMLRLHVAFTRTLHVYMEHCTCVPYFRRACSQHS